MRWIINNIKWIMLISGLVTCTMVVAFIAPQLALEQTFGQTLQGPLAEIIVRSWGAIITLIGAMLIFGAYVPVYRRLILLVAALSKLIFVGLVVLLGQQYLHKAGVALLFDSAVVLLFMLYLLSPKQLHDRSQQS